jgi:hypothetical protein
MTIVIGVKIHDHKSIFTPKKYQPFPVIIFRRIFTEKTGFFFGVDDVFDPPWRPKFVERH